jgi:hypothetical protein
MNDDLIALLREAKAALNCEIDIPLAITDRIDETIVGMSSPGTLVSVSDVSSLQRWSLGGHCDSFGSDCGAEMEEDDEGEFILLADVLRMAGRRES